MKESDSLENNLFLDVENRIKQGNKLLFSRDSVCLGELIAMMEIQNRKVIVLWALDCGQEAVNQFESVYPKEPRPRRSLELCEEWSKGAIKMAEAKRGILDAHAVAKEIDNLQCIALCHAIGHSGATVHVSTHAIGLPIYELTSIVLANGLNGYERDVKDKIRYYLDRLLYWTENENNTERPWAKFLS